MYRSAKHTEGSWYWPHFIPQGWFWEGPTGWSCATALQTSVFPPKVWSRWYWQGTPRICNVSGQFDMRAKLIFRWGRGQFPARITWLASDGFSDKTNTQHLPKWGRRRERRRLCLCKLDAIQIRTRQTRQDYLFSESGKFHGRNYTQQVHLKTRQSEKTNLPYLNKTVDQEWI